MILMSLLLTLAAYLLLVMIMRQEMMYTAVGVVSSYWVAMVLLGLLLFPYSSYRYVLDETLLKHSIALFTVGFCLFVFGVLLGRVIPVRGKRRIGGYTCTHFKGLLCWIALTVSALLLLHTFRQTGYIPLLRGTYHVSKYFQDTLDKYLSNRPLYTAATNILSAVVTFALARFFDARVHRLNAIIVAGIGAVLLLSTAKRGPILLPFLYILLARAWRDRSIKGVAVPVFLLVIMASLTSGLMSAGFSIQNLMGSVSTSFFVGPRELTRLLTFFDHVYVKGLTYVAGLLSFIPTKVFPLKANFNYMRYIMILQGANPDLSGGMRASYLGEAYINFGPIGVVIVSVGFGLAAYLFDLYVKRPSGGKHKLTTLTLHVMVVHLGFIAFFENGSSFLLFFLIRVTTYCVLLFYDCKVRVTTSINQHTQLGCTD